jgi:Flp pilus assembly protein TadG
MLTGNVLHELRGRLRTFHTAKEGNIAITFALTMVPVMILIGMGVDYTLDSKLRSRLDTIADSAALAALTPTVMAQGETAMSTAATALFNSQTANIQGVNGVTLSVTPNISGSNYSMTVTYQTTTNLLFAGFLGMKQASISGTSAAAASIPPNIDFYLLLDNSPSMDIAATTAGINTMVANTAAQGGCAFACHESNPGGENPPLGNPGGVDNYTLAQQLGVVTRIENMASATQSLMTTATSTAAANNTAYRMAIYTFNYSGTTTVQPLTTNLSAAQTAAGGIDVLEVYDNNWLTSTNNNGDTDTNFESAMTQINNYMPAPGTGASNSTPQEVLFLVTDGVDDEVSVSCSQPLEGTRCQQPFNTAMCTTVKNRGIRIAVLYTAYLPLPTNTWYNSWIKPFQSQISPNMQSCASPGLFFSVTTDGDITAAMTQLFNTAIATAHLTQ